MKATYYRDAYGCTASLRTRKDGSAVLKVSDGHGKRFWNVTYMTERGARIALGKLSDGWKEIKS